MLFVTPCRLISLKLFPYQYENCLFMMLKDITIFLFAFVNVNLSFLDSILFVCTQKHEKKLLKFMWCLIDNYSRSWDIQGWFRKVWLLHNVNWKWLKSKLRVPNVPHQTIFIPACSSTRSITHVSQSVVVKFHNSECCTISVK